MAETDWQFVQIRSWHVVRAPLAHARYYATLCGRTAIGDSVDTLPAGKSCESCARIAIRSADEADATNDEVPADG